uniref:Uncharacterized protein n=1 Tax=Siphoviridae sp. ct7EW56 TaxID=2827562 RepID=A0A8S5LRY9_9CAUD|nr:MAG TPA: hypothetical protein [Siphoviridae sp. ct7EW56]
MSLTRLCLLCSITYKHQGQTIMFALYFMDR